jgi:hypothetical protein
MSGLRFAAPFRPGTVTQFRAPKRTRFELVCEALESRQLLSISDFPAASASGKAAEPATVQPTPSLARLSTPASPPGLSPSQIETAYGVNGIMFNGVAGNGSGTRSQAEGDTCSDRGRVRWPWKLLRSPLGQRQPPKMLRRVAPTRARSGSRSELTRP